MYILFAYFTYYLYLLIFSLNYFSILGKFDIFYVFHHKFYQLDYNQKNFNMLIEIS